MWINKEWSTVDKLNRLERLVLLHSIIYYELDESIISDHDYNKLAQLTAKKVQQYKNTKLKKTLYGYAFKDFDGSTGFDLLFRLKEDDKEYLMDLARMVLGHYQVGQSRNHRKGKAVKSKKPVVKQNSNSIRDMLDGNLNRIMVTNDPDELEEQLTYAKKGLIKLYKANKKRLGVE